MSASPEPLPHAADANQARASDPAASSWVSANAGTGKTEVLVRRVLRLLLAGSEPQRVLCLTYTKMAAAEMQNRLLGELASWATLSDGGLAGKTCGASWPRRRRCGNAGGAPPLCPDA